MEEGQCEGSHESSERMMWGVAGGGSGVRSDKDWGATLIGGHWGVLRSKMWGRVYRVGGNGYIIQIVFRNYLSPKWGGIKMGSSLHEIIN